jgi:hypothetical protein
MTPNNGDVDNAVDIAPKSVWVIASTADEVERLPACPIMPRVNVGCDASIDAADAAAAAPTNGA